MKRTKRIHIRRITLGLAFAALVVPAGALAKPTPGPIPFQSDQQLGTSQHDPAYAQAVSRGNVYIPLQGSTSLGDSAYAKAVSRGDVYVPLQGYGISSAEVRSTGALGPDDRAVSRATSEPVVNPYRGWGPVIAYSDAGYTSTSSPDDRAFSKATSVGRAPFSGTVQSGDDSSKYTATAFALVLLAMSGITLLVWRNRKGGGRLSPA